MILYRYERGFVDFEFGDPASGNATINLKKYHTSKATPKGVWIWVDHKQKWVSLSGKKRFAYPTPEEALTNFIERTKSAIGYQKAAVNSSKSYLKAALAKVPDKMDAEKFIPSPFKYTDGF